MSKYNFNKKKRIVIKVGSNALLHHKTKTLDYLKIDRLAREISDIKNRGIDVCLVSSGAIAVAREMMNYEKKPNRIPKKQALAAVGQARLMGIYQKMFFEYNQHIGQVLMTKNTIIDNVSRKNAQNTFEELFNMGVIPVVNENDTISTYEIKFGDNDTLSAMVANLIGADLLILISDIDGLYSGDPRKNKDAVFIPYVDDLSAVMNMGENSTGSDVGSGGMKTKLEAAHIASKSGCDMIITKSKDFSVLHDIFDSDFVGTVFKSDYDEFFDIVDYLEGI